jgi:hypothetical protein
MSTAAKSLTAIRRAASLARKTYGAGSGRPKIADRCPCGAMSRTRAEKRRHRCGEIGVGEI